MKNRFLLFFFLCIFSNQAFSQDVPEEQRLLITKITATWCPPCGSWGWIFFEELIEDNEDKAVLLALHHSGQLNNTTATALGDNFNVFSQPRFHINNIDQGVSPSNDDAKRLVFQDSVNAIFASAPVVNAGIEILSSDQYTINVKTEFFQEAEGEYYVGVYSVANDLVNFQESIGNDAVHHKVLRDALTTDAFGELIGNGVIAAGTVSTFEYTLPVDDFEGEIITIIWKKVGDEFIVENVNVQDEVMIVDSNKNLFPEAKISIHPNTISSQGTIAIELETTINNASLEVYDLMGKKVMDIFQGNLTEGKHNFSIEKTNAISNGMYFVNLRAGEKVVTQNA